MQINDKLLDKAKNAKSAEELFAIAKENGTEITGEDAKVYFAQLNSKNGELADDELDSVAGGRKCGTIYKDNRPVVTARNTCKYYTDPIKKKEDEDGDFCPYCLYVQKGDILGTCTNPKRYNN